MEHLIYTINLFILLLSLVNHALSLPLKTVSQYGDCLASLSAKGHQSTLVYRSVTKITFSLFQKQANFAFIYNLANIFINKYLFCFI